MQPRHLDAKLQPVARRRQGEMADMKIDVEIVILDQGRIIQVERHRIDLLPQDGKLGEPFGDPRRICLKRTTSPFKTRCS